MLFRDFKIWQVFGANTDVGKSVVSALICRALKRRVEKASHILYLKPVSTGAAEDHDHRHILKYVPGVVAKGIVEYSEPKSPHIAARDHVSPTKSLLLLTPDLIATARLNIHRPQVAASIAQCP